MAGHSKWANIRFRKAAQDSKRGKVFTKIIREITVAARAGGGDPDANPRLRTVLDKALGANMKRDTIDRAVTRGAGGLEGANLEENRYEGYGPSGVAILVDCLTDNKNRTVSEVRHAFSKSAGHLGAEGSVSYLFAQQGVLIFEPGADEEKIMDVALEAGAEDIQIDDDGSVEVVTTAENFVAVKNALQKANFKTDSAELAMRAATEVTLDKDDAEKLLRLIDMLEDLDDVQEVYSNADIPESILAELA